MTSYYSVWSFIDRCYSRDCGFVFNFDNKLFKTEKEAIEFIGKNYIEMKPDDISLKSTVFTKIFENTKDRTGKIIMEHNDPIFEYIYSPTQSRYLIYKITTPDYDKNPLDMTIEPIQDRIGRDIFFSSLDEAMKFTEYKMKINKDYISKYDPSYYSSFSSKHREITYVKKDEKKTYKNEYEIIIMRIKF